MTIAVSLIGLEAHRKNKHGAQVDLGRGTYGIDMAGSNVCL
jgi:hypothetical protein